MLDAAAPDAKARVKANIGKLVAAAKVLGTRRNAGLCAVSLAFLRRFRTKLLKERKDAAALCTAQVGTRGGGGGGGRGARGGAKGGARGVVGTSPN